MSSRLAGHLLITILLVTSPRAAAAGPLFGYTGQLYVEGFLTYGSSDRQDRTVTGDHIASVLSSEQHGGGDSSFFAAAVINSGGGNLGARVQSEVFKPDFGDDGVYSRGAAIANAVVDVSYFDTITLTSRTLPTGTPVKLKGTLGVSATTNPAGAACQNTVSYGIDTRVVTTIRTALSVDGATVLLPGCDSRSFTLSGVVGQEMSIFYYLGIGALSSIGDWKEVDSLAGLGAGVDAIHTATLALAPDGDFTFSTASGNSLDGSLAAIPEPATLTLLAAGLAVSMARVRRKVLGRERSRIM